MSVSTDEYSGVFLSDSYTEITAVLDSLPKNISEQLKLKELQLGDTTVHLFTWHAIPGMLYAMLTSEMSQLRDKPQSAYRIDMRRCESPDRMACYRVSPAWLAKGLNAYIRVNFDPAKGCEPEIELCKRGWLLTSGVFCANDYSPIYAMQELLGKPYTYIKLAGIGGKQDLHVLSYTGSSAAPGPYETSQARLILEQVCAQRKEIIMWRWVDYKQIKRVSMSHAHEIKTYESELWSPELFAADVEVASVGISDGPMTDFRQNSHIALNITYRE